MQCIYSNTGHHPHPLGYLCAKFCFFRGLHCLASPWWKIMYSLTELIWCPGNRSTCALEWTKQTVITQYEHGITCNSYYDWQLISIDWADAVWECFVPPIITECQLSSRVNAFQCLIVQTLKLVLGVVDAISNRQQHQCYWEDSAKYKVGAWLFWHQTVNSLNNLPADVHDCQLQLVCFSTFPDHTTHCSNSSADDSYTHLTQSTNNYYLHNYLCTSHNCFHSTFLLRRKLWCCWLNDRKGM